MAKRKKKRVNPILEARRLEAERAKGEARIEESVRTSGSRSNRGRRGQQKKTKKGLELYPWVTVLLVVYILFAVVISIWMSGAEGPEQYGVPIVSALVASGIIIAVPTLLVWIFSRSRRASNIACISMVGFAFVSLLIAAVVRPPGSVPNTPDAQQTAGDGRSGEEAATNASTPRKTIAANRGPFETFFADPLTIELIARTGAGAADVEDAPARLDALAQTADRIGSGATGDGRALLVIAQALRDLKPLYAAYHQANKRYVRNGGITPATLQQRELTAQRLVMCDDLREATKQVHTFLKTHKDTLAQQLIDAGFSDADATRLAGYWLDISRWSFALPLRYHEHAMLGQHREAIQLMHDAMAYWQVDGQGNIRFTDLPEQLKHQQILQRMDLTMSNYRPILANLDASLRAVRSGQLATAPPTQPAEPEQAQTRQTAAAPTTPEPTRVDTSDVHRKAMAYLDEHIKAAENASRSGGKHDAAYAIIAELMRDNLALIQAYQDHQKAYHTAGAINPTTLESVTEIERRLQLLDEYADATQALYKSLDDQNKQLPQLLADAGFKDGERDRLTALWSQSSLYYLRRAYYMSQHSVLYTHESILRLYKTAFGKWTVADDGVPQFNHDVHLKRYDKSMKSNTEREDRFEQEQVKLARYMRDNPATQFPESPSP